MTARLTTLTFEHFNACPPLLQALFLNLLILERQGVVRLLRIPQGGSVAESFFGLTSIEVQ